MKRLNLLLAAGALLPAGAALASPFVTIDSRPTPHELVQFDHASPASISGPLAEIDPVFIRGIDMHNAREGAYLATMDGDLATAGVYHLLDGVSQKIADLPFTTTAIGGFTFNQAETGIFAALVPPSGPTTLYSISFDGNISPVGPITLAGAGSTDIAGLAVSPLTGVLYGLDNRSDSLIQIDPATGAATRVGFGLGMNAIGAGGLDFTFDGGLLLASTNNGRIVSIDTATGDASPLIGQLPFAAGGIAAIPEPATIALAVIPALAAFRRRS